MYIPKNVNFANALVLRIDYLVDWDEDNYINQVARIIGSQTEKLKKENINTIEKLAKISADKIKSKINIETKERLIAQAILQEEKRRTNKRIYFHKLQVQAYIKFQNLMKVIFSMILRASQR